MASYICQKVVKDKFDKYTNTNKFPSEYANIFILFFIRDVFIWNVYPVFVTSRICKGRLTTSSLNMIIAPHFFKTTFDVWYHSTAN